MIEYFTFRNRKYFVRNELDALLIFYDYFLFRPSIKFKFLLRIINIVIKFLIKTVFFLKLNNIFGKLFKKVSLKNDFIIRRRGVGIFPNFISLTKKDDKHVIIKRFSSENSYKRETNFINTYLENHSSKIKLSKPIKTIDYNIIYYKHIMSKNLSTLIKEGKYNKNNLFDLYESFCKEIDIFYENKKETIIHGDLTPDNVYLVDNVFYIIDYGDSHVYYKNYDKYIFLRRILIDYFGKINRKIIEKYFSDKQINRYENHLNKLINEKYFSRVRK